MKLYQAEWCPFSHRVRAKLTELGIDYELINVPASSKKRRDLEKVAGTTAIPVLVDGRNVITDSDGALSYLEKKYAAKPDELELHHRELSPTVYGTLPFGVDEAIERLREALAEADIEVAAALAVLKGLGLRGVLATGRSGMAGPQIIEIEGAPHDWLFPRMAAVVHYGGAGTTAEGLCAGKPTAVFPSNFGDQLFWGRRVHALGAGPEPVPQKKLTTERLAAAIRAVTENKRMRSLAEELGERIRAENGVARAVEIIGEVRRTS